MRIANPTLHFVAPPPPPEDDIPDEPWLPARDVTLITLGAFAIITLALIFH